MRLVEMLDGLNRYRFAGKAELLRHVARLPTMRRRAYAMHGVPLRLVARQAVEFGSRNRARTLGARDPNDRIQRGQRHREVRRVGGHAGFAPAKDRVMPVLTVAGRAAVIWGIAAAFRAALLGGRR
jgi:hypothetical protein